MTSELLLALAYCEGDAPAKGFIIDQVRNLDVSDLELLGLLLAVLAGAGRHQILRQYVKSI